MTSPKVSLILFAYNQEKFVRFAAENCLLQDYEGPLEIIFSDDFSKDDTYAVLQQLAQQYTGPHKLIVRRNTRNLGIGAHYNAAISECSGELIFTAAGDDISHAQRISIMVNEWVAAKKAPDLLTSNLQKMTCSGEIKDIIHVDDLSKWTSPEQWIRKRPYVVGAAHAFTRRMHETFGELLPNVVYEDQVMAFRASLAGGGLKTGIPLVMYREGGVSQTKSPHVSAADFLQWSSNRFSRQFAQYSQIQKDLITANRIELWQGKLRRRLHDAKLVLELHQCASFADKFQAIRRCSYSWWGFRVKQLVFLTWPNLAAITQRLQEKFK